jgi:signal transduction histidine kinase
MSAADVEKGARWSADLAYQLNETKVGVICLTPENLQAPWVLFEAGALSKKLDRSVVCPYLFGLEAAGVSGPLVQFQAAKADKEDTRQLVHTINRTLTARRLPVAQIDRAFDKWWPDLESRLKGIPNLSSAKLARRSERDILEEMLELVRMQVRQRAFRRELDPLALSRLVGQIRHELKAAIRGIQDNGDFLQRHRKDLSEDKIDQKLADIRQDCDALYTQIGNLEYHLSGTVPAPKMEWVVLARDVVFRAINYLKPTLSGAGLGNAKIECDLERMRGVRAYVDREQLCEVIMNLFENALKYRMSEDFRIKVEFADKGEDYSLRIRDWGMGVAPGLQERIFEEGFRAPEAIARVGGTGYGLTISRQMVRQMGGDLTLSNNASPTEFEISLPKVDSGETEKTT